MARRNIICKMLHIKNPFCYSITYMTCFWFFDKPLRPPYIAYLMFWALYIIYDNYVLLKVFDGLSMADPELDKVCAYDIPAPIVSTSNTMYVKFNSDTSVHKTGFYALFTISKLINLRFLTPS